MHGGGYQALHASASGGHPPGMHSWCQPTDSDADAHSACHRITPCEPTPTSFRGVYASAAETEPPPSALGPALKRWPPRPTRPPESSTFRCLSRWSAPPASGCTSSHWCSSSAKMGAAKGWPHSCRSSASSASDASQLRQKWGARASYQRRYSAPVLSAAGREERGGWGGAWEGGGCQARQGARQNPQRRCRVQGQTPASRIPAPTTCGAVQLARHISKHLGCNNVSVILVLGLCRQPQFSKHLCCQAALDRGGSSSASPCFAGRHRHVCRALSTSDRLPALRRAWQAWRSCRRAGQLWVGMQEALYSAWTCKRGGRIIPQECRIKRAASQEQQG